jgi:hypothetical protein
VTFFTSWRSVNPPQIGMISPTGHEADLEEAVLVSWRMSVLDPRPSEPPDTLKHTTRSSLIQRVSILKNAHVSFGTHL